ncbi:MAG: hypothetical protein ACYS0K_24150 [Planctomycetota bacterium]|jgi:hypothetical protein
MTTEQRLERLERENRWLRRIGAVTVAVAAAVFLIGQGKDKKLPDLEVRSVQVKDKDGKVRVALGTDAEGTPHLRFADEHGKLRAMLGTFDEDLLCLTLWDRDFKVRAALGVSSAGSPHLRLADEAGVARLRLSTHRDGSPYLEFYDAKGTVIWQAPR